MEEERKQLEEVMTRDAIGAESDCVEKREREAEDGERDGDAKKPKLEESSMEEDRIENLETKEAGGEVGEGEGDAKEPKVEESSMAEDRIENLEAKEAGGENLLEEVMEEAAGKEGASEEAEAAGKEGASEEAEAAGKEGASEEAEAAAAHLGPKVFCSSVEMFDYFYRLLHHWPHNLDINKYEHIVLLELLKQGHADAAKKIGEGIQAFQVRYHPAWKSKCYFVIRIDGSMDDFSFRKCVDHILPLPDNMKINFPSNGNKAGCKQKGRGRGPVHGSGGGDRGKGERGQGRSGRGQGRGGRGRGTRGR